MIFQAATKLELEPDVPLLPEPTPQLLGRLASPPCGVQAESAGSNVTTPLTTVLALSAPSRSNGPPGDNWPRKLSVFCAGMVPFALWDAIVITGVPDKNVGGFDVIVALHPGGGIDCCGDRLAPAMRRRNPVVVVAPALTAIVTCVPSGAKSDGNVICEANVPTVGSVIVGFDDENETLVDDDAGPATAGGVGAIGAAV
jgi:hypothetical protein